MATLNAKRDIIGPNYAWEITELGILVQLLGNGPGTGLDPDGN